MTPPPLPQTRQANCHIDRILRTGEETVKIGRQLATVLNIQQSGTNQTHADMISLASDVTILVFPEKKSVFLRGTPEAIEKAKNMIQVLSPKSPLGYAHVIAAYY